MRNRSRHLDLSSLPPYCYALLAHSACGGSEPASPPGQVIAFEDGQGIASIRPDGSGFHRITKGESEGFFENFHDFSPAWSPDGTRIAFLSGRDGNIEVYVADGNGSHARNLTSHPDVDGRFGFAWSPDGGRIAFVSERPGGGLWVVNGDGSGLTDITEGHDVTPAGWAIPPSQELSWSPDGKRIAFAAQNQGINVINADGSGLVTISQLHPAGMVDDKENPVDGVVYVSLDAAPAWSPDGESIAYLAGAGELHVMRTDGTSDRLISGGTKGTEVDYFAWSPEGRRIAFSPIAGHIFVVNSDGSCLTQLTSEEQEYWSQGATWSPDGKQIAFASNRQGQVDVYVMDDDGSGQTQVTKSSAGYGVNSATWSPDPALRADREIICEERQSPKPGTPAVSGTSMIITGKAGYLEGVASRTGEFQGAFVGAFLEGWRVQFCVQVLAEDDGSFTLEVPGPCFAEGETVWLTAGGMNACPTPPFKAGTRLETNVMGSSIVSRCEGGTPIMQPIGVPGLVTPADFSSVPQNNAGSECPPDPHRGFGYKIVFDWTDSVALSEIKGYWFRLQAQADPNPMHQEFVPASTSTFVQCNAYLSDDRLKGWYWTVLAEDKVGNRSEWSVWGALSFEPCRIDGLPCGDE